MIPLAFQVMLMETENASLFLHYYYYNNVKKYK